jgi:peptidoglycan hydrolase-like protein with peptidoglycan-binding domain
MTTCEEAYAQCAAIRRDNHGQWGDRYTSDYVPTVAHWQGELNCGGYGYSGPADGYWGTASRKAAQVQVSRHWGYTGPIDGAWGPNTWRAIQRMCASQGGYNGAIDGVPGRETWAALYRTFRPTL